jgi:trafficking protein particle complex subunit 8
VSRSIGAAHPHIPLRSHPFIFPLYNPSSVDVVVFWEIPSQQRSGHLLVPGITFGAGHAALKETIEDAEGIKVKRNMYAETQREKNEILDAVRRSEWNAEMNPIVVTLQHGHKLDHNFAKGCVKRCTVHSQLTLPSIRACHVQTPFILRNLSLTHISRFVLKLDSKTETHLASA